MSKFKVKSTSTALSTLEEDFTVTGKYCQGSFSGTSLASPAALSAAGAGRGPAGNKTAAKHELHQNVLLPRVSLTGQTAMLLGKALREQLKRVHWKSNSCCLCPGAPVTAGTGSFV